MIAIARVLLASNVEKLGHVGEIVDVTDGYARNFLFPKGLAVEPTEHNVARFAKQRAAHEAELLQREEKALQLKDKLADLTLVFERKAHDDDKLYGSVRSEDITAEIETLVGEHIEGTRIQLEHPIESLGPHAVSINLYRDIAVEVRILIKAEGAESEEGAEKE